MKNLMMAIVLLVGMTGIAQEQNRSLQNPQLEKMSPEQRNELRLKEMTLNLDLTAAQQKEMAKIIAEQSATRKAAMTERKAAKDKKVKLTADERFAKKSQMLDHRIEMKQRVKAILTPEQMEKWEKLNTEKQRKFKHGPKKMQRKAHVKEQPKK